MSLAGQLDLFAQPRLHTMARVTDPETSVEAAAKARTTIADDRQLALETIVAAGASGLTDHELAAHTGRLQTSLGVRRGELVRMGLVTALLDDDSVPVRRPSPSGSPCRVWVATEAGVEAAARLTP